jgi:Mrp family chromosome partitioning ATPase
VKPLAEIPARAPGDIRAGTLRRKDIEVLGELLGRLQGVVLVTDAGSRGSLPVAAGLASVASSRGVRTALLECDLESPALAGALSLSEGPGLHEYLLEEAEAGEILQPLVLAGPASAMASSPLICVVAGEPASDAARLLGSEGFRHAAERLRHAYEMVVVHGPPLDGGGAALESAAVEADAVLVCVDRGRASGRSGRKLKKALRRLPAKTVGTVVYG